MTPHRTQRWLLLLLAAAVEIAGCTGQEGDYLPLSSIARDGFARDGAVARDPGGREAALWGYVDHGNLYGDAGVKQILKEWWGGEGPRPGSWRFDLKAAPDDPVGHSIRVTVPSDAGRNSILRRFAADARAGRPTKVYLRGRLTTFDAPTNIRRLTGLEMELPSSGAIRREPDGFSGIDTAD